jgi:hypothetical protein
MPASPTAVIVGTNGNCRRDFGSGAFHVKRRLTANLPFHVKPAVPHRRDILSLHVKRRVHACGLWSAAVGDGGCIRRRWQLATKLSVSQRRSLAMRTGGMITGLLLGAGAIHFLDPRRGVGGGRWSRTGLRDWSWGRPGRLTTRRFGGSWRGRVRRRNRRPREPDVKGRGQRGVRQGQSAEQMRRRQVTCGQAGSSSQLESVLLLAQHDPRHLIEAVRSSSLSI